MKTILIALLMVVPVFGQINPASLVWDIRTEQVQQTQVNAVRSDGTKDKTVKKSRILTMDLRVMGNGQPEDAELQWFFVGKNLLDGKFAYYSYGEKDVAIPRASSIKLRIVSDPITTEKYTEYLTSVAVTSGSIVPHGWIARLSQGGKFVSAKASEPGLIDWMRKNPPPNR